MWNLILPLLSEFKGLNLKLTPLHSTPPSYFSEISQFQGSTLPWSGTLLMARIPVAVIVTQEPAFPRPFSSLLVSSRLSCEFCTLPSYFLPARECELLSTQKPQNPSSPTPSSLAVNLQYDFASSVITPFSAGWIRCNRPECVVWHGFDSLLHFQR